MSSIAASSSLLTRAGATLAIVVSFVALALTGCPSGGVGDSCVPEDEYKEDFSGFKVTEENIESRSFQCQTRICLVNHFQGRASCPNGQPAPKPCPMGSECPSDLSCVEAGAILADCDPTACDTKCPDDPKNCSDCTDGQGNSNVCGGKKCSQGGFCLSCSASSECNTAAGYECVIDKGESTGLCKAKVCSPATGDPETDSATLKLRTCYVPGTKIPIAAPVCSQCKERPADRIVYCSCRCGSPTDQAPESDADFNFCECPDGFVCEEIRSNVGLGDPNLTGKFCIRADTKFVDTVKTPCGQVLGHWEAGCEGTPPSGS